MSQELFDYAHKFVRGEISASEFKDNYIDKWRNERDKREAGELDSDPFLLDEILSTIFCLADMYYPESIRNDYEYDEITLTKKVQEALAKIDKPKHDEM